MLKFIRWRRASSLPIALLCFAAPTAAAEPWEPFPPNFGYNDFGDVGLVQTPTARFAPDGQVTFGANHTFPYDRYFLTIQGLPWLEATLRLTTVRNRLYSDFPDFSGNQSYKDRGFDIKLKILEEGRWTPAVALGLRDFVGTNLFSSEFIVLSKVAGPIDVTLGMGWGNMASNGLLPNPFRLLSSRFDDRGGTVAGGGALSSAYFKGRQVALFGGLKYDTPIRGLSLKAEYDSNDYKSEALGNRFKQQLPVNFGFDYAVRPWLHLAAAYERGNRIGLNAALTTNFNRPFRIPKFDPPANPVSEVASPRPPIAAAAAPERVGSLPEAATAGFSAAQPVTPPAANVSEVLLAGPQPGSDASALEQQLVTSLATQGAGVYAVAFHEREAVIYVAQGRFRSMAQGLGRVARAAFAALPTKYEAITIVFVENGMETISTRVYRSALVAALTPGAGSPGELWQKTEFASPPLDLTKANYLGPLETSPPRFSYSVRPFLRSTVGRPEQFLLYETGVRFNGFLQIARGLNVAGSVAVNLSDNFDKLRIGSDSVLPHVRTDIKEYLAKGKTSLSYLHADYNFTVAPSLYAHVYGGLFEEMFGGVGGEVLYRPALSNWALGANVNYVQQRAFNQRFGFRNYRTTTGFVTGTRYFPDPNITVRVSLGRYLAKDYGGTFEISRRFESGVTVGAFATKTNVSATDFGEGRFDKGIFLSVPLDAIYIKHVRGDVGLAYRPTIRDGGQMLSVPQPLMGVTEEMMRSKFKRDWDDVLN